MPGKKNLRNQTLIAILSNLLMLSAGVLYRGLSWPTLWTGPISIAVPETLL